MIGWADRIIVAATAACEESDSEARLWIVHSIFNRWRLNPARFGTTPAAVCMKRYQYSEYLPDVGDNANLERVLAKTASDPVIIDALAAYDAVAAGQPDPTQNATHFFADSIAAPSWTNGATFTGKRGRTQFYANVK